LLTYDQLLLATGARARLFPGLEGCLTLRTDVQARRIMLEFSSNARIGVIGGGFIGLELAATARQAGAEVTVIETAPRILGRAVPGTIAQVVHARHETAGVKILTGTGVTEAGTNRIVLANGIELEFDAVIAGVGAIPNTELAEKAGLFVDNGIVVDSAFRTSEPNIFAAGDCCNFEWRETRMRLESWKAAQDQGAHAAAAMLGASGEYQKVPWFWSDQFDLTLQVAGQFDLTRDIHHRAASGGVRIVFQCDQDARVSAAAGIGQGNTVARDMSVLEKLIERGTVVAASSLIDPDFRIKSLLK
ncbi:FAD-dependent oxidoreductase, partial [Mesorhizobium sp.]